MKLTVFLIAIIVVIAFLMLSAFKTDNQVLTSPQKLNVFSKTTPAPTPTPKSTPQTFQFNSETDLNLELEKVNPKVTDEDFQ